MLPAATTTFRAEMRPRILDMASASEILFALGLPLLAASSLSACTTAPSAGADAKPPAALTLTGVPPVPASLPARIGQYTEFKGAGLLDWSPDGKNLLVTFLRNNRTQLHAARGPDQALQPLTSSTEPTRAGAYLPSDPNIVVFERDVGGSETSRVYRLDLNAATETALTDEKLRCDMGPFNTAGTAIAVACSQVDRNAGVNVERTSGVTVDLAMIDVKSGAQRAKATAAGRRLVSARHRSRR